MHYVAMPDKGWPAIDATSLVKAAGATSYDRGVQYLREGAVTQMSWNRGGTSSAAACAAAPARVTRPWPISIRPGGRRWSSTRASAAARSGSTASTSSPWSWPRPRPSWPGPAPQGTAGRPGRGRAGLGTVRPVMAGGPSRAPPRQRSHPPAVLGIELTLTPDARPVFSGTSPRPARRPGCWPAWSSRGRKGWAGRSLSWTTLDSPAQLRAAGQPRRCSCCRRSTRSTGPAAASPSTTALRRRQVDRPVRLRIAPALAAAGRGGRDSACSWSAAATSARWTGTAAPNSAWT